jgi:bacterioferritin (cytochrome b1)
MAIEAYREIINFFREKDPTSRVMLEEILAKEEEQAEELSDILLSVISDRKRRLVLEDMVPKRKFGHL